MREEHGISRGDVTDVMLAKRLVQMDPERVSIEYAAGEIGVVLDVLCGCLS